MKNSTATILILVAVGLFFTFTNPQYAVVQNLRAEADEYQKVLDGAAAISETTEEIQGKYADIPKAEIGRLNKVLPDSVDTVRLALDLDGIAARYGISIRRVEVDKQLDKIQGLLPKKLHIIKATKEDFIRNIKDKNESMLEIVKTSIVLFNPLRTVFAIPIGVLFVPRVLRTLNLLLKICETYSFVELLP